MGPRRRYTLEIVRRATALLGMVLLAVAPDASADTPARALGKAYQAYREGNLEGARAAAKLTGLKNKDYAVYLGAQATALSGDAAAALPMFRAVVALPESRFRRIADWRAADCLW